MQRDDEKGIGRLASELMHGVSGSPEAVAAFRSIALDMQREQDEWIAKLRATGVKAAHPDDGWVDRADNSVRFTYPQFNDHPKEGDLIALGWPSWSGKEQHRIVRVTWIEGSRYHFAALTNPTSGGTNAS